MKFVTGYIESDGTYYYTRKFNMALSLCRVLGIPLYFSKGFSEAVAEALWSLGVTTICFFG